MKQDLQNMLDNLTRLNALDKIEFWECSVMPQNTIIMQIRHHDFDVPALSVAQAMISDAGAQGLLALEEKSALLLENRTEASEGS